MTKQELRSLYLTKRKELPATELAAFNLRLYNLFFTSLDLSFVRVLHTYLPLSKNQEPDTWPIVDRLRREFPNIRISIPRVDGEHLENFYFEGLHQLETHSWGIQEPRQGVITPAEKIDVVIVPLLVVDEHGHRVGYGKGYYDKFLKKCRIDCKKIGLSLFDPVKEISDVDSQDVRLDMCISPDRVLEF